jgi:thioesterase domain-containing protein
MPVATAYTESALASFMASAIGPVADVLGWSVGGNSYNLPISRTLRALGLTDVTTVTAAADLAALEAVATREAWRLVVQHLATRYDISIDQQSLKRSQLQAMAKEALILAEADVWVALAAPDVTLLASGRAAVTIHSLTYPGDPYGPRLDALGLTAEVGA